MPNPRLLILLLMFIGGALGSAALKPVAGNVGAVVGGAIGTLIGWALARAMMRKLF